MNPLDIMIIGAGMAGLAAARRLWTRTQSLIILDKGRGVGGRVATRRLGEARADHGAACFRLNGEALAWIGQDEEKHLALQQAPSELEAGAWTSGLGMNALAKIMAQGLPVSLQQTVSELQYTDGVWIGHTQNGEVWTSQEVLVTSPLWQSAEFFTAAHPALKDQIQDLARRVEYEPQWILMIQLPSEVNVNGKTYQPCPHPDIASIYDQGRKGLPRAHNVLVVQASRAFSLENLEAENSFIITQLTAALRSLGWKLDGSEVQAHRWRYARVKNPLGQNFITFETAPGLYFAGDFCLGSAVHLAAASGWSAADYLGRSGR